MANEKPRAQRRAVFHKNFKELIGVRSQPPPRTAHQHIHQKDSRRGTKKCVLETHFFVPQLFLIHSPRSSRTPWSDTTSAIIFHIVVLSCTGPPICQKRRNLVPPYKQYNNHRYSKEYLLHHYISRESPKSVVHTSTPLGLSKLGAIA